MALIKCPECGNEISNRVPNCIYCGCPTTVASEGVIHGAGHQKNDNYKTAVKKVKKTRRKKLVWILLPIVLIIETIISLTSVCEHEWEDATCTAPKTCRYCGETEGEKATHHWQKATCNTPKRCAVCGATEGKQLEHTWSEATCQNPRKCTSCGKTEGGLLSHTWSEATCSQPKTCTVCGETEEEAIPSKQTAASDVISDTKAPAKKSNDNTALIIGIILGITATVLVGTVIVVTVLTRKKK